MRFSPPEQSPSSLQSEHLQSVEGSQVSDTPQPSSSHASSQLLHILLAKSHTGPMGTVYLHQDMACKRLTCNQAEGGRLGRTLGQCGRQGTPWGTGPRDSTPRTCYNLERGMLMGNSLTVLMHMEEWGVGVRSVQGGTVGHQAAIIVHARAQGHVLAPGQAGTREAVSLFWASCCRGAGKGGDEEEEQHPWYWGASIRFPLYRFHVLTV